QPDAVAASRRARRPAGPYRWRVNGNTSLEEINYELDVSLEADGADRIAGWITSHAQRIPKTGDMIEAQDCRVTVLQMRKHRITLVQIDKPPKVENPEEEFA
ncbi:MAG: transporter associated domain-containing protein, partial [bacterium]